MSEETEKIVKLASAAFMNVGMNITSENPWSSSDVDKMESMDIDEFHRVVKACRFFYRRDSIVSSVINKLVDLGATSLEYNKSELSANESRLVDALITPLEDFAESMMLEYLISGLVVPEVKIASATREKVKELGIKKYETLRLPVSMWLRDPETIVINTTMVMDQPSYYVVIPEKLVYFILNDGKYPDGTEDKELWTELKIYYPEFILEIKKGARKIKLDNPWIIRRRVLTDSPYPTPYLYSAIEPLKHKRNLRRMDYSIASRVISAIQLFRLGNDTYPVTADQDEQFTSIKEQMAWRYSGGKDIERIFQLFANHTLQVDWVYPPVDLLQNERKYAEVNQDILFSLGFPKILIIGETERSNSSDADIATITPVKTINQVRCKIEKILNDIMKKIFTENNFRGTPKMYFSAVNISKFSDFIEAVSKLYDTGNLSRDSYAKAFGYNIDEEMYKRKDEKDMLEKYGLQEFNPQPFSPQPDDTDETDENNVEEDNIEDK